MSERVCAGLLLGGDRLAGPRFDVRGRGDVFRWLKWDQIFKDPMTTAASIEPHPVVNELIDKCAITLSTY
jgi:hypothetical protein